MPADPVELTIELRLDAGVLLRRYFDPLYHHRPSFDSTAPWHSFFGQGSGGLSGPEELSQLLNRGDRDELATYFTRGELVNAGHMLFELLFGRESHWEPIFQAIFQTPSGSVPPTTRGVRVRILSTDPMLLGLPWRVSAWRGLWLHEYDWTFEVTATQLAQGHVELQAPCKVLVIAPRCGVPLDSAEHYEDLQGKLAKLSLHYLDKNFLTRVENRDQLSRALQGMQPHIVYYYGHGVLDGGQPCLQLGGVDETPTLLTMSDFRRLLRRSPPKIAYLNGCMLGASGWHSAGHQLAPVVPCVVAHRTTAWTENAGYTFVDWLRRLLGNGLDPVVALNQLPEGQSTRTFEWATTVVWTNYKSWRTRRPVVLRRGEVTDLLDRDTPRALALKRVTDLIGSPDRRVEALVVFGAAGALVDRFGAQLQHYFGDLARDGRLSICLRWIPATERADTPFEHLEEHLGRWLGMRQFESLESLFRRHAGRSVAMPVVFLDWGVYGAADQPHLSDEDLHEWLQFAKDVLARNCPEKVRLVSYLALEVEEDKHGLLEETMTVLREEIRSRKFRSYLLPALGDVPFPELHEYTADTENSGCPSALAYEAAKLIIARTDGRYEETVQWIERAQEIGWNRLIRELRRGGEERPRGKLVF